MAFNTWDELQVDENGVVDSGTHLKPHELHDLVDQHKDEVVFFDGRNQYEAKVGRSKDAVVPDTRTSKDFCDRA